MSDQRTCAVCRKEWDLTFMTICRKCHRLICRECLREITFYQFCKHCFNHQFPDAIVRRK